MKKAIAIIVLGLFVYGCASNISIPRPRLTDEGYKVDEIAYTEQALENKNEIPEDFCLYDLPEFLNFQDMFDKPKIKLLKTENKIKLSDDEQTSEYYCSDPNIVVVPKKVISLKV